MNFREHAIGGVSASLVAGVGMLYFTGDPTLSVFSAVTAMAGALSPDIDSASIPSRWFARFGILVSVILMWAGKYKEASISGIIYMAFSAGRHRGWTHSWWFAIACFASAFLAYNRIPLPYIGVLPIYFILAASFGLGLCVHYLLDR